MLYRWFGEAGYDYRRLEIRNLIIYRPMIAEKGNEKKLEIEAERKGEGIWAAAVKSVSRGNERLTHIRAEMHEVNPVELEETVDLAERLSKCETVKDLEEMYKKCRDYGLEHTGLMKGKGKVYQSPEELWVEIAEGEEEKAERNSFLFHPVLIDGTAIGSYEAFTGLESGEKRLYLPLSYESFRAAGAFGTECLARIKKSSLERKDEIITISVDFFNKTGRKIGELKKITSKLVREAGLIVAKREEINKNLPETDRINLDKVSNVEGMRSFLQRLIGSKLKMRPEEVDPKSGYYELGLDSVLLLELVREIEAKLEASIAPTLLFEYTNIEVLSEYLSGAYSERLKQKDSEEITGGIGKERHIVKPLAGRIVNTTHTAFMAETGGTRTIIRDIAVIGMSGRYPKAGNIGEFWENLKAGRDCITEVPKERWGEERLSGIKSPSGKNMSKWGGFIGDVDCFDPQFFRISPAEAETMDPQGRIFLEVCWEAMEDAGYTPKNIVKSKGENQRRAVGVFAGVMHKDYGIIGSQAILRGQKIPVELSYSSIANRVSYFCDFHGPSMVIDTACSSSLTAVHLAVESILKGECEVAIAGGVNLSLHPNKYLIYGMMDMHSSDGYCHTFGEGGDGYVSADGVGAVLLKPLDQAVRDNDLIYGVIKGSIANHVGRVSGIMYRALYRRKRR